MPDSAKPSDVTDANNVTETEVTPAQSSRRRWLKLGGTLLGIILLILLIASVSLDDLFTALRDIRIEYLLIAYGLNVIMLGLMAYRWYGLYAISAEPPPSYRELLAVSFIGIFFSNFLPSTIGGDGYRAIHMGRTHDKDGLSSAFSIVFVDRVLGLLGLALVGLVALIIGFNGLELPVMHMVWFGVLFLALIVILGLSMSQVFHRWLLSLLGHIPGKYSVWFTQRLARLFEKLAYFNNRSDLLIQGLILSIVSRLVWLFGCYLIGLSLGLEISPVAYFVAIPIIELLRMIPITIQGLGVREALFVLFFEQYGVPNAEATLLAILVYLLLNLNGIVGGILFISGSLTHTSTKTHKSGV